MRDSLGTDFDRDGCVGRRVILSSLFINGQQHMAQCYQDAMVVARYFGKINYFITMTTNPRWREIVENLLPGQTAPDRLDLVARVFRLKQAQLLEDITRNGIFGRCVAHVYTIEFQKRGLPHMHLYAVSMIGRSRMICMQLQGSALLSPGTSRRCG